MFANVQERGQSQWAMRARHRNLMYAEVQRMSQSAQIKCKGSCSALSSICGPLDFGRTCSLSFNRSIDSQHFAEARMATCSSEAACQAGGDLVGECPVLWAEGLVVSSTGLRAEQRHSVRVAVQAGGGRSDATMSMPDLPGAAKRDPDRTNPSLISAVVQVLPRAEPPLHAPGCP